MLRGLDILEASQVLVYSKTSLQRDRISENSSRAIYFNDRAAVGYVPGSPRLELAMVGSGAPGVSFYTLDLSAPEPTQPMRRGDECFQCHALPDAGGLQGLLMRSAGVRRSGDPNRYFEEIDDRTPFTLRWGGWYVDARADVYARLSTILSGADTSPAYARLSTEDRRNIVHILEATVSDLPADFGEMALHTM
ncbi:MAG: hypothetical protein ABMA15_16020 [Vicinamibacterales bacterium]